MPMLLEALHILQWCGFIAAEITNGLLFLVIYSRDTKKLGSYKYLMLSFTVYSMIYAGVEILTQPMSLIYGGGTVLFMNGALKYDKDIGYHLIALYCSSFGICVYLLAVHFFYRYLAVCKPHLIRNFSGKGLIYLFLPPIFFGSLWFATIETFNKPTQFSMEHIRDMMREEYDEDSFEVVHNSALYFYNDDFGNLVIDWILCGELILLNTLMTIPITLIVQFTIKTCKAMPHIQMSKRTIEMQKQLFYTLLLQSLVPFFTVFLPVGLLLFFPFFGVRVGMIANFPTTYNCFYPAVDALIVFAMIKQFRDTLCRRQHKVSITSATRLSSSKI